MTDSGADDTYDVWFGRKVQEALDDDSPGFPHDEVEVEFAARRAAARAKLD